MIDAILERATNVLLSLMTLVHLGMEDIYLIGLIGMFWTVQGFQGPPTCQVRGKIRVAFGETTLLQFPVAPPHHPVRRELDRVSSRE